jgi:hypothetical protein
MRALYLLLYPVGEHVRLPEGNRRFVFVSLVLQSPGQRVLARRIIRIDPQGTPEVLDSFVKAGRSMRAFR